MLGEGDQRNGVERKFDPNDPNDPNDLSNLSGDPNLSRIGGNYLTRVKICGIKTLQAAQAAVEAGADALGFVFAPSPRRVQAELAREIILSLPPFVSKVGVFVNEARYIVEELGTFCKLDVLQFHGSEPPEYCRRWSYQIIKSFPVGEDWNTAVLEAYGEVNAFLLDTKVPGHQGGTGQTFDWSKAEAAKACGKPIILAGGLNPRNVREAVRQVQPFAIDVSSGVEINGEKDCELIKQFLSKIRRYSLK